MDLMWWWMWPIVVVAVAMTVLIGLVLRRHESIERLAVAHVDRLRALPAYRDHARRRVRCLVVEVVCWAVAAGCVWLASREWFGPQGLVHPSPDEFARRIAVGAVCGACIVVPVALAPRESWLSSEWMRALGRWSYGVFMWHVAVLAIAFPLLGVSAFSGSAWDFAVEIGRAHV